MENRTDILRARRRYTESVVLTVLFTAIELWATVAVVVLLDASGVLAVSAALVLSAGLMCVVESWQTLRARSRELRSLSTVDEPFTISTEASLVRL